jgi:UDP-galactopyranose mutase
MYDYLIVGAGLFGSLCAYELQKRGYKCLVIDKRANIAGNIYTKNMYGINVHMYGAHIFHTSNKEVWDYINQFAEFNNYINSPIARYKNECYNLPFNMNTFTKLWPDVFTPNDALNKIEEEKKKYHIENPTNLEEQAINLVGPTIYNKLIKGYTEKQWGKPCKELPAFIIKRLPVRFTFDNNYFNDRYQGIPVGGYTKIIEKMLDGIEVRLNTNFKEHKELASLAKKIIYTGCIDEFYDYKFGELEYRSVRFENEVLDTSNYQGNAVINYTEREVPYTRIIEHKHFEFDITTPKTVISKEYSSTWKKGEEPYYPINNEHNNNLYLKYKELSEKEENIIFGGRLGLYKYYDMDDIIESALNLVKKITD